MKIKVGHYKETNIAWAPEATSCVLNKYTDTVESYVFGPQLPIKHPQPDTHLVHSHNRFYPKFTKQILQYHSPPEVVDIKVPGTCKTYVIAQYHATLPVYRSCVVVRNPIDIWASEYTSPKPLPPPVRIGYSPSTYWVTSGWADKGYAETKPILERIASLFKDKIQIDIITNVPLSEALHRKAKCHIFIDEVKTSSYHRSGLEAVGMGIPTICSLSESVISVIKTSANAPCTPFLNTSREELEEKLINLIEMGFEELTKLGLTCRAWMEDYWGPQAIASEYVDIYEEALI